MAKLTRRLAANATGDFYVDDSCIDCGACRWIAPETFGEGGDQAFVERQPEGADELQAALRALVSCPTASIGATGDHDVASVAASFPVVVADGVYHCGYHDEDSFGAASWFITRAEGNVLVDSPRFAGPLVRRLEALGGVELMFLTHRDDVAEHARFAAHFGCERVLHADDVTPGTRGVERQPTGDDPIALADDLLMIPVPGHTRGSACLLYRGRLLFTGDHLAFSRRLGHLYAFRDACWHDWRTQLKSMRRLAAYDFEHVLPGHGAPCSFEPAEMRRQMARCLAWMAA